MKKRYILLLVILLLCSIAVGSSSYYPSRSYGYNQGISYQTPSSTYTFYPAGKPVTLSIYGNYEHADVKLYKIPLSSYFDDLYKITQSVAPIQSWQFSGEMKKERRVKNSIYDQEHDRWNYEYEDYIYYQLSKDFPLNPAPGIYQLAINGASYQKFIVTNISGIIKVIDNKILFVSSDPARRMHYSTYDGQSFREGAETVQGYYSGKVDGPLFVLEDGDNILPFETGQYRYDYDSVRSEIYTDRPVYRPNQTVFYKAIFWTVSPEKQFASFTPLHASLRTPTWDTIDLGSQTTDAYGAVYGTYILPDNAPTGDYTLDFSGLSQNQQYTFAVQEYRKPEFELTLTPDKEAYTANDTIRVGIAARYYFGEPVPHAAVTYEIYESTYAPPCRGYFACYYESDLYAPYRGGTGTLVTSGDTTTDAQGMAHVTYSPQPSVSARERYTIVVSATDQSRKPVEQTVSVDVVQSFVTLAIYTDRYSYSTGNEIALEIYGTDSASPDGDIITEMAVNRTESWAFGDKPSQEVQRSQRTLKNGYAVFRMTPDKAGLYAFTVSGTDSAGNPFSEARYLRVYDSASSWTDQLEIDTDKDYYEPGDNLTIYILSPVTSASGLFTIEGSDLHQVKDVYFDSHVMKLTMPVTENLEPNIYLSAVLMQPGKVYTATSYISIIPKNKYLNITISTDKETYGIRDKAQYTISVKNAKQQPQQATLSLGIVDEPIYSIYPDNTQDIFFAFNQQVQDYVQSYQLGPRDSDIQWISSTRRTREFYPTYYYGYGNQGYYGDGYNYSTPWWEAALPVVALVLAALFIVSGIVLIIKGKPVQKTDETGVRFVTNPLRKLGILFVLMPILLPAAIALAYFTIILIFSSPIFALIPLFVLIILIASVTVALLKSKWGLLAIPIVLILISLFVGIFLTSGIMYSRTALSSGSMESMDSAIISPASALGSSAMKTSMNTAASEQRFVQPVVRRYFPDTIYFNPSIQTDTQGRATVHVTFPDSLTTWRTTVKAYTTDFLAGQAIKKTIVRKNIIARLIAPRFFTQGDSIIVSGIAHNYLDNTNTVRYNISATKNLKLVTPNNVDLSLPADVEKRVDFTFNVTGSGSSDLVFAALTDKESDAMQLTIPVYPRGVYEEEHEAIALDSTQEFTIDINEPFDPKQSTFSLSVSGTIIGGLLGSLGYLTDYPYGCVEQTLNRFVPTLAVRHAMQILALTDNSLMVEAQANADAGLQRLYDLQNNDGSFGWWGGGNKDHYMTTYATYGMHTAQQEGIYVDSSAFNNAQAALFRELRNEKDSNIQSFMYYVYSLNKPIKIKDLPKTEQLNPYGKALLALAFVNANETGKAQSVAAELALEAHCDGVVCSWDDAKTLYPWRYNSVESTAWVIRALLAVQPDSQQLPKAVRYLMVQKGAEGWSSTKDTGIAVIALADYAAHTHELAVPFTYTVYQDGILIAQRSVSQEEIAAFNATVALTPKSHTTIRVEKEGGSTIYVYKKLRYLAQPPQITEKAQGLLVRRVYEKQQLTSGDEFNVTLVLAADKDYEYVQVLDPLPSGAEYVKDSIQADSGYISHLDVRDEQLETYFDTLHKGTTTITYKLRAEIPGDIHAMPATARLMYLPQITGHSAQDDITVYQKAFS